MALEKNINSEHGLDVSAAYHRISTLQITEDAIIVNVNVYASQQAYQEGRPPVEVLRSVHTHERKNSNFLTTAYTLLKSDPRMIGAVDA